MKVIHIAIITAITICLIFYFNTKPKPNNYDREWVENIRDSFERLEKQYDTIFKKQDTFIYHERKIFITKTIAIDSLKFDSLFKLWTEKARFYQPLCDSAIY